MPKENEKNYRVRIPEELHRAVADLAKKENRSLNGQILEALQEMLENRKQRKEG